MLSDFGPSNSNNTTLDGMEFDAASWDPFASNSNGNVKNLDCNGDGVIDYCNRNVGTSLQVSSYGVGYDSFVQAVKQGLIQYDTDLSRPAKMLLADGEAGFRSIGTANGAEFESFPNWDNYLGSSSALAQLELWTKQDEAGGSHLSYAFTKDVTPLYNQASSINPNGCITPDLGGTCRNANFRYGMAAALVAGAGSSYNNEASFRYPQPWDEGATINQVATGLAPGYLGAPLGPAKRNPRYTSGELATDTSFGPGLGSATPSSAAGVNLNVVADQTTAAPGFGTSIRASVTTVLAAPSSGDAKINEPLIGAVPADQEYTVDFWAKTANAADGPPVLALGVSLNAVIGAPQMLEVGTRWTHYILAFRTTLAVSAATVRFSMGSSVGQYWIDGISVHQGTAGIVTREFTNGIVVFNDSFTPQSNVALPGGLYHHINGVQDRSVNDGTPVGAKLPVIDYKDGEILLRD